MAYKLITTDAELAQFADALASVPDLPIAFDCETTGLFSHDEVVGFSFSWRPGTSCYVPLKHFSGPNVSYEAAVRFLRAIKNLKLIYHNAKFDRLMILTSFKVLLGMHADTMLYAAACAEPQALKDLGRLLLNKVREDYGSLMKRHYGVSWEKQGWKFAHLDSEHPDVLDYAGADADDTLQVYLRLKDKAAQFSNIVKIEENLISTVMKMNLSGCPIDVPFLEHAIVDYEQSNLQLEKEIYAAAGKVFSINSPKALAEVLFQDRMLPVLKRSRETGAPSTDKEVLDELAELDPVAGKISQFRKDSRMLTAYIKKIPAGLYNGRIYTSFNQVGAVSGRFTSSGVTDGYGIIRGLNLQNIPKQKGNRKVDMRAAFIAPPGWTFVKCDYSQIEYRVMACLSQDKFMCDNFRLGVDFHTTTAMAMYDIDDPKLITSDKRDMGKIFNFGLSFGMSARGLAARLGCTEQEAQRKSDDYFLKVPGLCNLIEAAKDRAKKYSYTETYFGRRRPIILAGLPQAIHDRELRKSFNTMVQGTAADILKIAMLRIQDRVLNKYTDSVELLIQVHDELDFLVRNDVLDEVLREIKTCMEMPTPPEWVPIIADISYGPNWSEDSQQKYKVEDFVPDNWVSWREVLPENLTCSV